MVAAGRRRSVASSSRRMSRATPSSVPFIASLTGNDICIGLIVTDNALLRPVSKTHFENTTAGRNLKAILPPKYRTREQGRVVVIEPAGSAPSWLSQRIPRFRLQRPEPVRLAVLASLYMHYEMARNPHRQAGFMFSVPGSDFSTTVGPLVERNRTLQELLSIIAERSRGGMWIGLNISKWEFIEFQHPEEKKGLLSEKCDGI
jgi:hypothetical protein